MSRPIPDRRMILGAAIGLSSVAFFGAHATMPNPRRDPSLVKDTNLTQMTFTKTDAPAWLMNFWREIDEKTWGKGFDCFTDDAVCNLGVADWHGREAIRDNLRKFIDTGFTAHHEVLEYWDSTHLKMFRGKVTMTPNDGSPPVRPTMAHFFYMDEKDPTKVKTWLGAVGPVSF